MVPCPGAARPASSAPRLRCPDQRAGASSGGVLCAARARPTGIDDLPAAPRLRSCGHKAAGLADALAHRLGRLPRTSTRRRASTRACSRTSTGRSRSAGCRPRGSAGPSSPWSAGYGADRQDPGAPPRHRGHSTRSSSPTASTAASSRSSRAAQPCSSPSFARAAQLAASDELLFTITHSEIDPIAYASSTATASYLLDAAAGQATVERSPASDGSPRTCGCARPRAPSRRSSRSR